MSVAGIDFSTRAVDVVEIDEDDGSLVEWHRFELVGPGDSFDRSRLVRDAMPPRGWWTDRGIVAAGLEDPRGYGAGHLYRVQGAILACLPATLLVQPWLPSKWRTLAGLKGNATKDAVADHVENLGIAARNWPQDACDAFCIARATRAVLEHAPP